MVNSHEQSLCVVVCKILLHERLQSFLCLIKPSQLVESPHRTKQCLFGPIVVDANTSSVSQSFIVSTELDQRLSSIGLNNLCFFRCCRRLQCKRVTESLVRPVSIEAKRTRTGQLLDSISSLSLTRSRPPSRKRPILRGRWTRLRISRPRPLLRRGWELLVGRRHSQLVTYWLQR